MARALDLVGERWTLLLVRNLLMGPRRYGDLLEENPGITTNLLAERLASLASAGVVEKVAGGDGVSRYRLTPLGRALDPVVQELGRFGQRLLTGPPAAEDRVDLLFAFSSLRRSYLGGLRDFRVAVIAADVAGPARRRFTFSDADAAEEDDAAPATDAVVSALRVTDDVNEWRADVVATADVATWLSWLRGESAAALEERGALAIEGSRDAWRAFLGAIAPWSRPRDPPRRPPRRRAR